MIAFSYELGGDSSSIKDSDLYSKIRERLVIHQIPSYGYFKLLDQVDLAWFSSLSFGLVASEQWFKLTVIACFIAQ